MDISVSSMEYDIEKIVNSIDFNKNSYQCINNIMLTNFEIEVLEKNGIDYKKCNSLKEVLYEIENVLDDMEIVDDDLDLISEDIAGRDYYLNTNK